MASFWDHSWETISTQRILEYIADYDLDPDDFIHQLHIRKAETICDAGCGCGIYSLKLAANGFSVSGFDISAKAVAIASGLLQQAGFHARLQQASILATPYPDGCFDCVLSRDVLDHMPRVQAKAAIRELLRITAPGGLVCVGVDHSDEEYEAEPHFLNADNDYIFTQGKWNGMVFHPYTPQELAELVPENTACTIENTPHGLTLQITKSV